MGEITHCYLDSVVSLGDSFDCFDDLVVAYSVRDDRMMGEVSSSSCMPIGIVCSLEMILILGAVVGCMVDVACSGWLGLMCCVVLVAARFGFACVGSLVLCRVYVCLLLGGSAFRTRVWLGDARFLAVVVRVELG